MDRRYHHHDPFWCRRAIFEGLMDSADELQKSKAPVSDNGSDKLLCLCVKVRVHNSRHHLNCWRLLRECRLQFTIIDKQPLKRRLTL